MFSAYCPYCNSLHKAIENQNFCSQQGDAIQRVSTNAYYFKSNDLNSGKHVSRFSIRTISDGYQRHVVDNEAYMLDNHHYLIINEGEAFHSEIKTNTPVEGLLVAFNQEDCMALQDYLHKTDNDLLDDPFEHIQASFLLETQKLNISPTMQHLLHQLKLGIISDQQSKLYFEELFLNLLEQILADQREIQQRIFSLNAKKKSTQIEIFRRLRIARDYLEAHLQEEVKLAKLSKVAAMSPYHFLRNFKKFYRLTPHQYLTQRRVQFSRFLLKDSLKPIAEIAEEVGFQSQSAFGRLFKKEEGISPHAFRELHH